MKILIKNGRVVDPASGLDLVGDLAIATGRIVSIGQVSPDFAPARVIDASGCIVAPGLVDLAVRLREPGHEHEGMLESELAAAAAGGVTSVVCLPDTDPTLDEPGLVEMLKLRARKLSRCRLFPLGALTRGLKGENLTEMAELHEAGCVGYSQAEVPIRDTQVLQRAMQYAATFGYTVWLRPQDAWLGKGIAASGAVATRLGLSGVPVSAETIALHTIVELVRVTGARVHLCRISSAAGVEIVRQAKAQGLPITADVSINSLLLTDVDIGFFNSAMRLVPPLRQGRDRDALQAALRDGTLDALVSDHTPVSEDEKMLPFGEAEPGATGLELLLSLALKGAGLDAGEASSLDLVRLRQALGTVTSGPVKVLGDAIGSLSSSAGRLVQGGVADICVFDPRVHWQVEPGALVSQGKHTPFAFDCTGMALPGRVRVTLVAGQIAHEA
ncbi:MAG TPA: dihydroorotase [Aquabacterium sp.]|nr:dihydroorotase [Aquabacterium sp.]HRH28566.1 dihydroorotase [Aquabacterium sp.]